MLRNLDWYNLNEQRCWPLDASSTGVTDSGVALPHNMLADIHIIHPEALGRVLYVGAVTGGANVASITLLSDAGGHLPVAAVSVASPEQGRMYALEPLYEGVRGWVVFGAGATSGPTKSYSFSTAAQSRLQSQSCKAYKPRPLTSVRKYGVNTPLTGLVRLTGGNDFEVVKETVEIDSVVYEAGVFRLKAEKDLEDRNVFEIYAGDCSNRAESRNCGDPEPIEFINNVAPDCCGTITLEFRGCAAVSKLSTNNGVIIDCGFGLEEACVTQSRLPDSTGKLPNEYDDLCVSYSISIALDPEDEPPAYSPPSAEAGQELASLPTVAGFTGPALNDMIVARGGTSFENITGFPAGVEFKDNSVELALTTNITLPAAGTWRVETWHYKATTNSDIASGASHFLRIAGTNVQIQDALSPINASAELPADGNWFHIRFEKDVAGSNIVEVFIDGVSVGTKAVATDIVLNALGNTGQGDCRFKEMRILVNSTEYEWPLSLIGVDDELYTDLASGNTASSAPASNDYLTETIVGLKTDSAEGANIILMDTGTFVDEAEWTTLHKELQTEFKIAATSSGGLVNGGIVFNYRESDISSDYNSYCLVELSLDGSPQLKVRRFTGVSFFTEGAVAVSDVVLGRLYRLRVKIEEAAADDDGAWVTGWLTGISDDVYAKIGPTYLPDYRSAIGNVGLYSNRSVTTFSGLRVRNKP